MIFFELNLSAATFNDDGYCRFDYVRDSALGDPPVCFACGTPISPRPALPPLAVKLQGTTLGDLCASGFGTEILLSRAFVRAWRARELNGMVFHEGEPKKVRAPTHLRQASYCAATIAATVTRLDEEESGLEVKKLIGCKVCGVAQRLKVDRVRVNEKTWSGEDIFMPSGLYGVVLVSSRAADLIDDERFTNFPLVHQDDYRESVF